MNKRNVSITLQNIDRKLETAIHKIIDNMSIETMNLNVHSRCDELPCPVIQINICDQSKKGNGQTKNFVTEYRELNKNLQNITFKYMKATDCFIEFEYGNYC